MTIDSLHTETSSFPCESPHLQSTARASFQRDLESPIAKAIIAGKYPPGATVRVTAKNGELVL